MLVSSDTFILKANLVKAFFEKDLYDIIRFEAEKNVFFESKNNDMFATGEFLTYETDRKLIYVQGNNSVVKINSINMLSNDFIEIIHSSGLFKLQGEGSHLYDDEISIIGAKINGSYKNNEDIITVQKLAVEDKNISKIKTENIEMYAKNALYEINNDTIELFENVKVIRGKETVIGDYALINLSDESYYVKTNDSNKKVKIFVEDE